MTAPAAAPNGGDENHGAQVASLAGAAELIDSEEYVESDESVEEDVPVSVAVDPAPPSVDISVEIPVTDRAGSPGGDAMVLNAEPLGHGLGGAPLTKKVLMIGAAAAIVAGLVTTIVALTRSPRTGSVVVALDADGTPLATARIAVDGELRCEASPCRVAELASGSHSIRVTLPDRAEPTERTVTIQPGAESRLEISLAPAPVAAAPEEPATPPPAPAEVAQESSSETGKKKKGAGSRGFAAAPVAAQAASAGAAPAVSTTAAEEATGTGRLMVQSTPSGDVFVDGRAYGPAPRQMSLPAGPHTVVVEHPEFGKQSVNVTVFAGKTAFVALEL